MCTAQDFMQNIVNMKQRDFSCFFIKMQQILDKCCNRKSVANVYELKSQPSYKFKNMSLSIKVKVLNISPRFLRTIDTLLLIFNE